MARLVTILGTGVAAAAILTGGAAQAVHAFNTHSAPASASDSSIISNTQTQHIQAAGKITPVHPDHGQRSDDVVYPAGLKTPVRPHKIEGSPINTLATVFIPPVQPDHGQRSDKVVYPAGNFVPAQPNGSTTLVGTFANNASATPASIQLVDAHGCRPGTHWAQGRVNHGKMGGQNFAGCYINVFPPAPVG
jgi:hypothetical protein